MANENVNKFMLSSKVITEQFPKIKISIDIYWKKHV